MKKIEPIHNENYNVREQIVIAVNALIAAHNARVDADPTNPEHPVHPWYGPCDAFDHGQCFECRKTLTDLRAQIKRLNAAKSPTERILPKLGTLLDIWRKTEDGLPTIAAMQLATVEAICKWLEGREIIPSATIAMLRADARLVVEEAIR